MAAITPAQSLFDLTGEVALVTGASSGLGLRFAEVLSAHGAKDRLDELAARLPNIHALALNVADASSIAAALAEAEQAFGPATLLVNNAGVASSGKFIDADMEEWERVRQCNVDGVWHLSQAFARRLIALGIEGAIINIASVLSYRVTPGAAAYAVTK
jgi:3-oxoacyl-[acyl-carrier protein] reductase